MNQYKGQRNLPRPKTSQTTPLKAPYRTLV